MQSNKAQVRNLAHVSRDVGYRFVEQDPVLAEVSRIITESGKSLEWISNKCGVTSGTLRKWMNGSVKRPQHITVKFVLKALGYDLVVARVK